jgi:hypothetical protein
LGAAHDLGGCGADDRCVSVELVVSEILLLNKTTLHFQQLTTPKHMVFSDGTNNSRTSSTCIIS